MPISISFICLLEAHFMVKLIKRIVKALICGFAGGSVMIVVLLVFYLEGRPSLKLWHQVELDAEFTADRPITSFADYLSVEKKLFSQLDEAGKLTRFPPVLAFQSIVDATVSTHAVIDGLFRKLPANSHDLVLFDFNRISATEQLFVKDSKQSIEELFNDPDLSFSLSLVTNASGESPDVIMVQKIPGSLTRVRKSMGMKWPKSLYSLSHVALPFSEDDPLYGMRRFNDRSKIQLGNIDLRGERGVLAIPAADMLRLRWNPFYSFMERRILEFMGFKGLSKAAGDAN
jgi:hypothetical protein